MISAITNSYMHVQSVDYLYKLAGHSITHPPSLFESLLVPRRRCVRHTPGSIRLRHALFFLSNNPNKPVTSKIEYSCSTRNPPCRSVVCVKCVSGRPPWSAHNAAKVSLNSVNSSLLHILSVLSPSRAGGGCWELLMQCSLP